MHGNQSQADRMEKVVTHAKLRRGFPIQGDGRSEGGEPEVCRRGA
jgi:hypothetical protein